MREIAAASDPEQKTGVSKAGSTDDRSGLQGPPGWPSWFEPTAEERQGEGPIHLFSDKEPGRDAEAAAAVEEEIHQSLFLQGLSLVCWYHSHPHSPALPSLKDIDAQIDYQLRLQGSSNGFQPCLTLLCSLYYSGNPVPESKISPFWVMPPPKQRPSDYGIPMDVEMAYVQDSFLTNDILHEMMLLVEFYKGALTS
ncbi:hypothetical protein P7K49_027090 [Saguinus oedipus]|uniref:JAB domain-containing protein n=1 Tax=Saguinus oedipus TaxID=9490 RepID=A0ABQ9UF04_SAGOE|nr:hypothetical protein P7K49_027090 [Saguinus oedipus]